MDRHPDAERKGAKNPYTSVNGWMTNFVDPDGRLHLRMGDDDRTAVAADGGEPTKQYCKNMPEFVGVPEDAFADDTRADALFAASWDWSGVQATQVITGRTRPRLHPSSWRSSPTRQ